jgi:hypothetical protein
MRAWVKNTVAEVDLLLAQGVGVGGGNCQVNTVFVQSYSHGHRTKPLIRPRCYPKFHKLA